MKQENVILPTPASVVAGLDDDYVDTLVKVQKECMKRGVSVVANEQHSRAMQNDKAVYALPHPIRKRWVGYLPLHMEVMINEEPVVSQIMRWLSFPEIEISNLVKNMVSTSPSFKELIIKASNDLSCSNYGAVDPIMFPHAFYAKGSKLWKVDEELAKQVGKAPLPESAPIGFVIPPHSNMYIKANTGLTINNKVSGDHKVDGFYINQYIISAERVVREWEESFNQVGSGTMNGFMRERGYIKRDGGALRVIEVLATGECKDSIVDDATFNFSILIQDESATIGEVLKHHNDYYGGYQTNRENIKFFDGVNLQNAGEREFKTIEKITYYLANMILYMTSEDVTKKFNPEHTNMQRKAKTHVSSVMRKRAAKQAEMLYDYTEIKK